MSTTSPTPVPVTTVTIETATADRDKAAADLAAYRARAAEGLATTRSVLRDRKDALEHADLILQGVAARDAAAAEALAAAIKATAAAEIRADLNITHDALQEVEDAIEAAVEAVLRDGVAQLEARDAALMARSEQAIAAGLLTPTSFAGMPEQIHGQDVSPFRGGVVIQGIEILPENPIQRRSRAVRAAQRGMDRVSPRSIPVEWADHGSDGGRAAIYAAASASVSASEAPIEG